MRALTWFFFLAVGVLLMLVIGGMNMSPEKQRRLADLDHADKICDQAIADSALGSERRSIREICDKAKANIEAGK